VASYENEERLTAEAELSDSLEHLADSVLEGRPVDWDAVESNATVRGRGVVRQLRLISAVAAVHREAASNTAPASLLHSRAGDSLLHSVWRERDRTEDEPVTWGALTILEMIGRGTYSTVYRAHDPRLDRPVALKLLRRREKNADAVESAVIEEGRLMARVRHPNVVTIYGAERIDGRAGLWMELVGGRTLEDELREHGPFAAADLVAVGGALAAALEAVHRAGLVHRDVKAQNVMRDADGRILLTDFGAGHDIGEAGEEQKLVGTPLYLAPEVLAGEPASAATDLYSLGVVLYHLATGSFPVRGRSLRDVRACPRAGRAHHGTRSETRSPKGASGRHRTRDRCPSAAAISNRVRDRGGPGGKRPCAIIPAARADLGGTRGRACGCRWLRLVGRARCTTGRFSQCRGHRVSAASGSSDGGAGTRGSVAHLVVRSAYRP
jgi:tRNA A-37 threonylcarbamoyl transferase component Bud32